MMHSLVDRILRCGLAAAGTATLLGCAGPGDVSGPEPGVANLSADAATSPLAAEARAIAAAISGRVVVATFTNPMHGEGIAEVVYYRRDGTGFVDRLAARDRTLRTFHWEIRARPPARGPSYVFISSDGRDDGAAVTFTRDRQRLAFSDVRYGPYFSFGVIQSCWPGFMSTRPPDIAVCNASTDAATLQRLEVEHTAMASLRATARPRTDAGAFTTQAGAVYTNSLGNIITVRQVKGRTVTFTNQHGSEFTSHALLYSYNPRVMRNEAVFAAIDSLWPLAVGKTAEAWVYNGDWAWKLAWKVTRHEAITVPAGTFEAWAIEHTESSMGDGYIGKSETWYAPSLGWNVRYRSWIETQPRTPPSEWALVTAKLPRS